ncbi:MAG: glycosyltransferase family 4 protein [Chloroflexota bacterium]
MQILINALFMIPNQVGGSETYVRGLIRGLAEADESSEYVLALGPEAAATIIPPNRRWRIVVTGTPSRFRAPRLAAEQVWLPRLARAVRADVIHSTGYTGPLLSDRARVTSIHDMNYKRHPEDLSPAEWLVYSLMIPMVARRSHKLLALSDAARADILRWTGAASSKVAVVYPGVRSRWPGEADSDVARLAAAGVTEPFVVSVAASYPHKNLRRLIQAFPLEVRSGPPVQLVVVGLAGRAHRAVVAEAAQCKNTIKILGWVDDALVASLYRRSLALAFPSLYEGFGLPILEAMALGAPVVTSGLGTMIEVANGAAELVDPYDVASIHQGLQRLVDDKDRRETLRQLGFKRAAEFSWERAARQTLEVYAAAAASC